MQAVLQSKYQSVELRAINGKGLVFICTDENQVVKYKLEDGFLSRC